MTRDLSQYRSRQKGYRNRYLKMKKLGYEFLIDNTGTVRRLEALQTMGYSLTEIGRRIGRNQQNMSKLAHTHQKVYQSTRDKVAAVYDELAMIPYYGGYSARTRAQAAQRGYAPPLAWDDVDIDDPDAQPKGMRK